MAFNDPELARFVREIDLVEYAQKALGFEVNKRKTAGKSTTLDRGDDRIFTTTNAEGRHVYKSARDPDDAGTIIRLVQTRLHLNLGQVRQELRPWVGLLANARPTERQKRAWAQAAEEKARRKPEPSFDYDAMAKRWDDLELLSRGYLRSRGITDRVMDAAQGVVKSYLSGVTCFSHVDATGKLCGFEQKGPAGGTFCKGGKRGLFVLRLAKPGEPVTRIAVTEAGVDALSYAELARDWTGLVVVSTSGAIMTTQLDQLKKLAERHGDPTMIAATDRDEAGEGYAQRIEEALPGTIREVPPDGASKDWNDFLRSEKGQLALRLRRMTEASQAAARFLRPSTPDTERAR